MSRIRSFGALAILAMAITAASLAVPALAPSADGGAASSAEQVGLRDQWYVDFRTEQSVPRRDQWYLDFGRGQDLPRREQWYLDEPWK